MAWSPATHRSVLQREDLEARTALWAAREGGRVVVAAGELEPQPVADVDKA